MSGMPIGPFNGYMRGWMITDTGIEYDYRSSRLKTLGFRCLYSLGGCGSPPLERCRSVSGNETGPHAARWDQVNTWNHYRSMGNRITVVRGEQ